MKWLIFAQALQEEKANRTEIFFTSNKCDSEKIILNKNEKSLKDILEKIPSSDGFLFFSDVENSALILSCVLGFLFFVGSTNLMMFITNPKTINTPNTIVMLIRHINQGLEVVPPSMHFTFHSVRLFSKHFYMLNNRFCSSYKGILPCFLVGKDSFLSLKLCKALIITGRVVLGSIIISTIPCLAA